MRAEEIQFLNENCQNSKELFMMSVAIVNICKLRVTALLLRVPRISVIQTTAGVMPERSKPPNLALKRNAKSPVSHLGYKARILGTIGLGFGLGYKARILGTIGPWAAGARNWYPFPLVMCSRSSVIPGCGVLTT